MPSADPVPAAILAENAEDIRESALLGGRVRLLQPSRGYRAAIDPVLLAASIPARPGERVLELGCGAGAALLCLAARVPEAWLTGLELQPAAAELARRSVVLNGWAARVQVVTGDLSQAGERLPPAPFHHVLMNPPYYPAGGHTESPIAGKAVSHGLALETGLEMWSRAAARHLRARGSLTVIYPADRLPELLAALGGRFGAVRLLPLWPRAGQPARRVLVQARRDARGPACLLPGLVLHGSGPGYTPEADAILRDGAALALDAPSVAIADPKEP